MFPWGHPGNAGVTSLSWDFPGSTGGFPAPRGAEQEEAAAWEGCILQLMARSTPRLLAYFPFKAAAP